MNYAGKTLVWIREKNGRELGCRLEDIKGSSHRDIDSAEIEWGCCINAGKLVGSKR